MHQKTKEMHKNALFNVYAHQFDKLNCCWSLFGLLICTHPAISIDNIVRCCCYYFVYFFSHSKLATSCAIIIVVLILVSWRLFEVFEPLFPTNRFHCSILCSTIIIINQTVGCIHGIENSLQL